MEDGHHYNVTNEQTKIAQRLCTVEQTPEQSKTTTTKKTNVTRTISELQQCETRREEAAQRNAKEKRERAISQKIRRY